MTNCDGLDLPPLNHPLMLSLNIPRRCLCTITSSTCFLLFFLCVVITAAGPCPTSIESNHDYVWSNCSLPTGTTWIITPAPVTGTLDFANVSIVVIGGTVLPYFKLASPSQSILTITNVSIHFEDYVSSLPISHPFVRLPLACGNVTIVLRRCRFAVNGTAFTDQSALSFVGHSYSAVQISNVHIAFHLCTIHTELSRTTSLVALSPANNSNGITLVVEDSTIGITTTGVDVSVFQISSNNQGCTSFSSTTVISDIVFRLQRSNITFTQNCTDPSSLCGNGTKPNGEEGKQKSDCALVYWDTQNAAIHHAELLVEDTSFQSNLLLLPLSDAGTGVSRSMTLFTFSGSNDCPCFLSHMSVSVSNVTASIVTGKAATLLYFRNVGELSDAVVVVQDSEIALTANSSLRMFEGMRSVAVIQIDNNKTVGPNVTIRVTRVVSHLSALSGERLPAASSSLIITSAALLYCSAGVNIMTLLVRDCRTVTDISGGYLPLFTLDSSYRELLSPMAVYNMLSTLLVFDRQCNVTWLHASIVNCSLTSSSGLIMGTASPRELESAAVISATTLMTMATNCTLSTFVIRGCSVNVTSLFFPKMSTQLNTEAFHQQKSGLNTTSGFVLLNITALFQGFDTMSQCSVEKMVATGKFKLYAPYILQALPPEIKTLMTPIIYDAVNVSIADSVVVFPQVFNDFKLSDVVAFVSTPAFVTKTVIDISKSMQANQKNTLPVTVISMLSSAVENCVVRVTGLRGAGPIIVASMDSSSIGLSTSLSFANNSFRAPGGSATTTSASAFASGVTTSLNIHTVKHTGGSVFDISDNTFFGDEHHTLFSNVTWVSSPSPTTPLIQSNKFPVIHLGCNRLNDNPLAASNIGIPRGLLHTLIDYPPGPFHGGGDEGKAAWCAGLPPDTQTITTPLPFEEVLVLVPTSAVAAAWVSAAASLGSLLSLSPAVLVEGQTLAVMGSSACAPPALRTSTSITQYTLSPFYALGPAAMVLGNGGLALFIVASHALLAMLLLPRLALRREHHAAAAAAAEGSYSDQHRHRHVDPSVLSSASATTRLSYFFSVAYCSSKEWRIRLQFPNHSLTAGVVMLQGIVFGATSELFTPSPLHILCGVVGLGLLVAAWLAHRHVEHSPRARLLEWRPYAHRVVGAQRWVPRRVLPLGRWEPEAVRMTHGRLRGPVRATREAYALYPLLCSLVVSVVAGLPVPPSWCVVQWSLLTCVPLAGCAAGARPAERCAVRGGLRAAAGAVCGDGAAGQRTRRRCR